MARVRRCCFFLRILRSADDGTRRTSQTSNADIDAAFAWYESRRIGLGLRFNDELTRSFAAVEDRPHSLPTTPHFGLRRALPRVFPYAVYFREMNDRLAVIAALHTSRDAKELLSER